MASTEIMVARPMPALPSAADFDTMARLADAFYKSGLMPQHIANAQAAFVVIQKGRELGIPPMESVSNIYVIGGKPACYSQLMLSLIYRDHGGNAFRFTETTAERATARYKRREWSEYETYSFTMEDAQRAELNVRQGRNGGTYEVESWRKFPDAMLRARCISAVARLAFPDTIGGMYTPEELGAAVEVRDGEVVVVEDAAPAQPVIEQSTALSGGEASPAGASPTSDPWDIRDEVRQEVRARRQTQTAPDPREPLRRQVAALLANDPDGASKMPKLLDDCTHEELEKTITWLRQRAARAKARGVDMQTGEVVDSAALRKEYETKIGNATRLATLKDVEWHVDNDKERGVLAEADHTALTGFIQTQRDALTPLPDGDPLVAMLDSAEAEAVPS